MGASDSTQLSELRSLITRLADRDGVHQTAIRRLYLIRYSESKSPEFGVIYPGVCVVAQGQTERP